MDSPATLIGAAVLGSGIAELRWRFSQRLTGRPSSDTYYRVRRGSFLMITIVLGSLLVIAGLLG